MRNFVAKAFRAADDAYGNDVLVVLTDEEPVAAMRQAVASAAVQPATVFVAADRRTIHIHNRQLERRFAGHPLLGAAAVLRVMGFEPTKFITKAGPVDLWHERGFEWLHAQSAWSDQTRHRQLADPAEVEALAGAPADEPVQVWAWLDEPAGRVRARMFAPSEGKPEDEACGSASMLLATKLGRELTIVHGEGSVIHVRPGPHGVDLGGRTGQDAVSGRSSATSPRRGTSRSGTESWHRADDWCARSPIAL